MECTGSQSVLLPARQLTKCSSINTDNLWGCCSEGVRHCCRTPHSAFLQYLTGHPAVLPAVGNHPQSQRCSSGVSLHRVLCCCGGLKPQCMAGVLENNWCQERVQCLVFLLIFPKYCWEGYLTVGFPSICSPSVLHVAGCDGVGEVTAGFV